MNFNPALELYPAPHPAPSCPVPSCPAAASHLTSRRTFPAPSSPLCRGAFSGWKVIPGGVVPYCLSARRPEWLQTGLRAAQTPSLDLIVERTRLRPGGPDEQNRGEGKASPACKCAFFLLKGRLWEVMEPRGRRHGGKEVTRHLYPIWWSFPWAIVGKLRVKRTVPGYGEGVQIFPPVVSSAAPFSARGKTPTCVFFIFTIFIIQPRIHCLSFIIIFKRQAFTCIICK